MILYAYYMLLSNNRSFAEGVLITWIYCLNTEEHISASCTLLLVCKHSLNMSLVCCPSLSGQQGI